MNVSHETVQKMLAGYIADVRTAEAKIVEVEALLVNLRKNIEVNSGAAMACKAMLDAPAVEEAPVEDNVAPVVRKKRSPRKTAKK